MKTNTILRSIVLTILAAFAGTAFFSSCSREEPVTTDEPAQVEELVQNTIHVTLNAQMADDASTRATYAYGAADAADRKVTIENGDKLNVKVVGGGWGYYGILSNTAGAPNTFSGDLTSVWGTYSGSDIIKDAKALYATLLPIGYGSKGFLSVDGEGAITTNYSNAFSDGDFSSSVPLVSFNNFSIDNAAGVAKTVTLSLQSAVLCFTISGLTPNADHAVSLSNGSTSRNGTTHTNGSGVATFSFGYGAASAKTYTLSIDGYEPVNLGSKTLAAGHLYKISRTAAPVGAVPGKFSVSSTKQVYFSKGNLKYVNGQFRLHANQYDRVWTADNDDVSSAYTASGTFDLFGWATSGIDGNGATAPDAAAPYLTSTTNNLYGPTFATYNTISGESDWGESSDWDWGANVIYLSDGTTSTGSAHTWRTLTAAEWTFVLTSRDASTVNGTANARYCKATIASTPGLVLFPDAYTHPGGMAAPTSINNDKASFTSNSWTAANWTKMEAAGAVFLPGAGSRNDGSVSVDSRGVGVYRSSTAYDADCASCLYFYSTSWVSTNSIIFRYIGMSVRLVQNAN